MYKTYLTNLVKSRKNGSFLYAGFFPWMFLYMVIFLIFSSLDLGIVSRIVIFSSSIVCAAGIMYAAFVMIGAKNK